MNDEINQLEENLRQAMLTNDLSTLDELIADTLVFTMIDGAVLGKAEDLEAHRSEVLKMASMEPSDQRIQTYDDVAVVTVRMRMRGTYAGSDFEGVNRYTRVWLRTQGRWQIIAGHVSPVQSTGAA
jgi:ketosteroid isomerase-like protein